MGSILIKQQTEKVKVIVTPTWTKHVPKQHSITIPDMNVKTKNTQQSFIGKLLNATSRPLTLWRRNFFLNFSTFCI